MPATDERLEAKAIARYIRMSPTKVRRVLDTIRGRTYQDALIMLEFMPYAACEPIRKVLESAAANAEHNLNLDKGGLIVSRAFADGGPTLKRFKAGDRGRARPIRKRTSHITIAVATPEEEES
ncbi:50S ribosomal protein L22 [Candidatus Cyanaurora vandensis]|uniref:50S ribosomal protein L22 n=1 Tax=Candidatus Cyanaurora vandensis TaxID=2714958 RepID=UPI00257AC779|nr:50S ribosomal protein L22 [Candidatus Cyanaurora vandensis]